MLYIKIGLWVYRQKIKNNEDEIYKKNVEKYNY